MKEKKTNKAAVISLIILFVLSAIYLITPMIGGYNWYGAYVGSVALVFLGNGGFGQVLLQSLDPGDVVRLQNMVGCFARVNSLYSRFLIARYSLSR